MVMTPQIDVITIGSAVFDLFISSDNFHLSKIDGQLMVCESYGEKIEIDGFKTLTGGGATNVAVALARLGFQTSVLAETGRDSMSAMITAELEREEVDTSLIIRERKEETGGSVILLSKDGGRTIMVHRGAASMLTVSDLPQAQLLKSRWWHISSIAGQKAVLQKLFTLARLYHIGVSWNPGKLELQLLEHGQLNVEELEVEVMFVNHEEWDMIRNLHHLLRRKIPLIVVTNGARGGIVISSGKDMPFTAQKVKTVDETGAGDAFAAGFVAAHLHGLSAPEC
ncbi:MAG TPA: carbohydrate kinase family protein, partial [Allocoleopsis sp.]